MLGKARAAVSSRSENLLPEWDLSLKVYQKPAEFWWRVSDSVERSWQLLTFCPRKVTSLTPYRLSCSISARTVWMFLLLSLPLTKGTMQKEHMLLHPLMMERKAETECLSFRMGVRSAQVSSADSWVLILKSSSSIAMFSRRGKSRQESGPHTTCTPFSNIFSLSLSAMQPRTPITLYFLNSLILAQILSSAASLIAQVLRRTMSAIWVFSTSSYCWWRTDLMISESLTFIWQPQVSMWKVSLFWYFWASSFSFLILAKDYFLTKSLRVGTDSMLGFPEQKPNRMNFLIPYRSCYFNSNYG